MEKDVVKEIVKERIKENEKLFSKKELKLINLNCNLIKKIYLLGALDESQLH